VARSRLAAHLKVAKKNQPNTLATMQVRAAVTVFSFLPNSIFVSVLVNHRLFWSMRMCSLMLFLASYLIDVLCCKVFLFVSFNPFESR
jgi:hypothetical protein